MKLETGINADVQVLDANTGVWEVIRDIAKKDREDPFFICDTGELVRKHKIWKTLFSRVEPFYSVKCNSDITVLKVLAAVGASFDCASKTEIQKVLSLGVSPKKIIFAHTIKQVSHIQYASSVGVDVMTFDNDEQLRKIKRIFPTAKLIIRIRCDATVSTISFGAKFGCNPVQEAPRLLALAKSLDMDVIGVSFHVGTGCQEPYAYYRAIKSASDVFDMAKKYGYSFSVLDIGGGYPGTTGVLLNKTAAAINSALDEYFPNPSIRIIAEPGRYYVASAFTLACKINSIRKITKNDQDSPEHYMYYINEGVFGSLSCVLTEKIRVNPQPLTEYSSLNLYPSSIWGPTCDGIDCVIDEVLLPRMKTDGWIIFEDMGAYTICLSTSFNGFSKTPIYYVGHESTWNLLDDTKHFFERHHDLGIVTARKFYYFDEKVTI